MIRPRELASPEPLFWSTGAGTDVWDLFCAAIAGDVARARQLLAKDPSLVRSAFEYRTALSFAVRENQLEMAALLLERGADPINSGTSDTLTQIARDRGYGEMRGLLERVLAGKAGSPAGEPVAAAIRDRDPDRLQALIDRDPALLHAPDERTNQPIHWAVMTRQVPLVDWLLDRGADIEAQRQDGARPIQLANGDYLYRGWRDVPKDVTTTPLEVIAHLRGRGAECDICTASHIGDRERVRELLDRDPSLANRPAEYVTYYACSGTPLRNAAGAGHRAIVELLLDRGADPNLPEEGIAPRGHALYSAVYHKHHEVARLLLERGAYPNAEVESSADALSIALRNEDDAMVRLLCSHGASRKVDLLAYYGDVRTAAAVFAANPALADDSVALENATAHEDFVRLMLRYQPDLPRRAAACGSREVTELLFRHGMDPNHRNWLHITPLHRFAASGKRELAIQFIERGADLDARDEEYRSTPLGYAARCGRLEMVELLLEKGAKLGLPDDPPWARPEAWAARRGHAAIVARLSASSEPSPS